MECHHSVEPTGRVWIAGGSGRSGRAIAGELLKRGLSPVLIGRDQHRLAAALSTVGGGDLLVASTVAKMADEIAAHRPSVVVNTIGPFLETAPVLVQACLAAGVHYADLANDLAAVQLVLRLDTLARAAGCSLVTGAGFGVTATESVVTQLAAGLPTPLSVRVTMVPSLEMTAGELGDALAGTIVTGLPGVAGGGRYAGRCLERGQLVKAPIGGDPQRMILPDGSTVTAALMPLGELLAAQRASGAPSVQSASSEAPSSRILRSVIPLAAALLSVGPVRSAVRRLLAKVSTRPAPKPREHSWGHARLRWADGTVREGWLAVGEAQAFTGALAAEVAARLAAGRGGAGAHTPVAAFGPSLAESCGGVYILDSPADRSAGNPGPSSPAAG